MKIEQVDFVKSYNVSARGMSVEVFYGGVLQLDANDFPGDADPLSVDQIQFAKVQRDVNGEPFRISSNPIYSVSLSLIPGSNPDKLMCDFVTKELLGDDGYVKAKEEESPKYIKIKANYDRIGKKKTYDKGFFTGMTPGFTATADGRIATHIYNFEFSSVADS